MEETQTNDQFSHRVVIKQNAKGFATFEVSAKGNSKEEVSSRLNEVVELAIVKCQQINQIGGQE